MEFSGRQKEMRVRDSQLPHPSTFRGTVREFIGVSV